MKLRLIKVKIEGMCTGTSLIHVSSVSVVIMCQPETENGVFHLRLLGFHHSLLSDKLCHDFHPISSTFELPDFSEWETRAEYGQMTPSLLMLIQLELSLLVKGMHESKKIIYSVISLKPTEAENC